MRNGSSYLHPSPVTSRHPSYKPESRASVRGPAAAVCLIALSVVMCGRSRSEAADISVRDIAPDVERTRDAVKRASNKVPASDATQGGNLAHPGAQSNGSDSQDIPTLARIWPTDNKVGISGFSHALLFYGLGPTDLTSFPSGNSVLKALTDEETAIQIFGKSPFVRTRNGVRYFLAGDPVFQTEVGEMHRDQCVATFAALNLPLGTPIHLKSGGAYSISNLLSESVANFSFDQHEPAWTAIAYAKYLPPKKEWTNRFGEGTSFSQLAQHLLHLDSKSQSCAGTHVFQALVKIDNADRRYSILSEETRRQLDSYLTATLREVVQRQQAEGDWNKQWCGSNKDEDVGSIRSIQSRILVTGHLLEVLCSLDPQRRLPRAVYVRAAEWVKQALNSPEINSKGSLVCPFTHAARAARDILKETPANRQKIANTFHPIK